MHLCTGVDRERPTAFAQHRHLRPATQPHTAPTSCEGYLKDAMRHSQQQLALGILGQIVMLRKTRIFFGVHVKLGINDPVFAAQKMDMKGNYVSSHRQSNITNP